MSVTHAARAQDDLGLDDFSPIRFAKTVTFSNRHLCLLCLLILLHRFNIGFMVINLSSSP
jgi:hypothetical protein